VLRQSLNQLHVNLITKAYESDSVLRMGEIAPSLATDIEALQRSLRRSVPSVTRRLPSATGRFCK
jgi:hypothetical protein